MPQQGSELGPQYQLPWQAPNPPFPRPLREPSYGPDPTTLRGKLSLEYPPNHITNPIIDDDPSSIPNLKDEEEDEEEEADEEEEDDDSDYFDGDDEDDEDDDDDDEEEEEEEEEEGDGTL